MKAIIRNRETGKARELIEYAVINHATIAAENPDAFKVKAHNYGYDDVNVIGWSDLLVYNEPIKENIVIHNIDKMMNWFCGGKLIGFSATKEEE